MQDMQQNPGVPVFELEFLFTGCPAAASQGTLQKALAAWLDTVVSTEDGYQVSSAKICIQAPERFEPEDISDFTRGQMWNIQNANALIRSCTHRVRVAVQDIQTLSYKERGDLIVHMTEAVLDAYADCTAVYTPASGRMLLADQVRNNPARGGDRFLYLCVNTRLFSVNGTTGDMMVDTVGLHTIGLPDLQYHFHSLKPQAVMKHAYSVASLIYAVGPIMKSGETIDGMDDYGITKEIRWPFQYQQALIEPPRIVMAITPGEYAV